MNASENHGARSHIHLVPRAEKWKTIRDTTVAWLVLCIIGVAIYFLADLAWPDRWTGHDWPLWLRVAIGVLFVIWVTRGQKIVLQMPQWSTAKMILVSLLAGIGIWLISISPGWVVLIAFFGAAAYSTITEELELRGREIKAEQETPAGPGDDG